MAIPLFDNEIYTAVGVVEIVPGPGSLGPQPHLLDSFSVERILLETRLHEALEESALLGFRSGDRPDVVQYLVEAVNHSNGSLCLWSSWPTTCNWCSRGRD